MSSTNPLYATLSPATLGVTIPFELETLSPSSMLCPKTVEVAIMKIKIITAFFMIIFYLPSRILLMSDCCCLMNDHRRSGEKPIRQTNGRNCLGVIQIRLKIYRMILA